ncbi:DUF429 domain-containing protein [Rhodovulum adriaticum]|uniref:Putative RNase H-like nuclease n=1 Tax=Rhodovulum adriaticum TaxID=35804 RepID=A0A4V6NQF8_RHOAD|nr:DUF429 domain-containing protein [Rhodovulum adriaticum]MBK1636629.1 hypothetical protein [Rhodovulum adriaticum]TCP21366.1 putative RNase H-like nuclease [Rhodovulum adriaticum]
MVEVVLGIDAAWTDTNPSGVALAVREHSEWQLIALEPSYSAFLDTQEELGNPLPRPLIERSKEISGEEPDLVMVDMPLSLDRITGRRAADNAVSRVYGARKASTHTPSTVRPGQISDVMRSGFADIHYNLRTVHSEGRLVETYPHPALIELLGEAERLPYKFERKNRYWPNLTPPERKARLREIWMRVLDGLSDQIKGVKTQLSLPETTAQNKEWKAFEDKLDAIICVLVGIAILDDRARPYGDDRAAIWLPEPR